jgi:hypothetical protein
VAEPRSGKWKDIGRRRVSEAELASEWRAASVLHAPRASPAAAPSNFQLRSKNPQSQGGSSQFPGVLVGPPHVRKCHQMSSKEHIQLGRVVRWVLSASPPPGPPRGSAVCACRASTSLAPLYSPCASQAFGWGSNPNSRSAPAPVESSPGLGLVLWPVTGTRILFVGSLSFEAPNPRSIP